jgi:NAD(P)-dependent dehydrogenase (short-subunit alcohol dehydrogenase family)
MKGKIAIVTGGSRGLGKNTALKLAANGASIIITYKSRAADAHTVVKQITSAGGKAVALQLDASRAETFAGFATEVRNVLRTKFDKEQFDFLVNNAGISVHANFAETTAAQFQELFDIHLKGPFFLTQALLPLISDGGRIVNISTGLTRFSVPGYSAYAMMKGGIEVLTRYLAKELGSRGIAVNTVAPGAIETDFGGGVVRDNPDINRYIASNIVLGRVGLPEDIGGAVKSLLSDENGWVNAQRIEISGGMFI